MGQNDIIQTQEAFSLTYQLGKVCRDDSATGFTGDTLLLLWPTGTTFQPEARRVTQNIGRTAKDTIGEKNKHTPHFQRCILISKQVLDERMKSSTTLLVIIEGGYSASATAVRLADNKTLRTRI